MFFSLSLEPIRADALLDARRYKYKLRIFKLDGGRYAEIALSESRFWIPELELGLGVW